MDTLLESTTHGTQNLISLLGKFCHLTPHLLHKSAPETHYSFQLYGVLANQKLPTTREVLQAAEVYVAILKVERSVGSNDAA